MSDFRGLKRSPALATPEQLAAEAILRSLLEDAEVKALLGSEVKRLRSTKIACESPDAQVRLAHVCRAWTGGLIMRSLSGDPQRPAILLTTDNTPRHWFGYDIPATGAAGDNPDHIYRNAFIDGAGKYRIHGRINLAHRPIQFGIEVTRGEPAKLKVSAAASGTNIKPQIDIITDKDIQTDEDGRFTITLSRTPSTEPNSLLLVEESVTLIIRDVLSDWSQHPTWLRLERLDKPSENFSPFEVIKQRLLRDLPDYLSFWTDFPLRWMGGVEPNSFKPPVPRDGGWGWQAGVRHALKPDQFMVVTMRQGGAAYLGIQSCDPWFIGPDARYHNSSLNKAQAHASEEGLYTFVIGPEDPGVLNWIDTGGLHDGLLVLRWQAVPLDEKVQDHLIEVRTVDRTTLKSEYSHLMKISSDDREEQKAAHAQDYHRRFEQIQ